MGKFIHGPAIFFEADNSSVQTGDGMIKRNSAIKELSRRLKFYPTVGLLGPRQSGKTTLAGQLATSWGKSVTRFDLENERDLERLRLRANFKPS